MPMLLWCAEPNPYLCLQHVFIPHICHSPSFLFSVHSTSSLSVFASNMMMLIKWTEWIIQIPMAVFLPSVWSAALLCSLEEIIHLVLSLYTLPPQWVHTHTTDTLTHFNVNIKGDTLDGFIDTFDWWMLHCVARMMKSFQARFSG